MPATIPPWNMALSRTRLMVRPKSSTIGFVASNGRRPVLGSIPTSAEVADAWEV